jgi:hypothetical protein
MRSMLVKKTTNDNAMHPSAVPSPLMGIAPLNASVMVDVSRSGRGAAMPRVSNSRPARYMYAEHKNIPKCRLSCKKSCFHPRSSRIVFA